MSSTFAWLDHSDRDRKRALEVVDLFADEETRDELGIGSIRDAVADRLFPGTSVVQTRLRYFLFVPWIFAELDGRKTAPADYAHELRRRQDKLRRSLVAGGEETGVVGFRAGYDVQRLPSNVYWYGLRRWKILRFAGSEGDYARTAARAETVAPAGDDPGEPTTGPEAGRWDPRLPEAPEGWLGAVTFALTEEEAGYLTHRLRMEAPESLLVRLVEEGANPGQAVFVWDLEAARDLPAALAEELEHARCFSEGMHGAALLYNLLLAEAKEEALARDYEAWLADWWQACEPRRPALRGWDRRRFWSLLAGWGARVSPPTRAFVESWLDRVVRAERVDDIVRDRGARISIAARERVLKGARARLGNPRALNLWRGASGTAQLDYRWGRPVRSYLLDLLRAAGKAG